MRTVQEIFNLVIARDLYPKLFGHHSGPFMCVSIDALECKGTLTVGEKIKAKVEIDNYFYAGLKNRPNEFITLKGSLENNGLPYDYTARRQIYENWAKRPIISFTPRYIGDVDNSELWQDVLDNLGDFTEWLFKQYVDNGDKLADLTRFGYFTLHNADYTASARFEVVRTVTCGDVVHTGPMLRVSTCHYDCLSTSQQNTQEYLLC